MRHFAKDSMTISLDREVVITRFFNAAREILFKSFTEPDRLKRWWGPRVFSTPECEMDLRPGGAYRIVMRSPEGIDYPMKGFYREVVEPERLVYSADLSDHPEEWHETIRGKMEKRGMGKPPTDHLVSVAFEAHRGGAKLTIRMLFRSAEVRDAMMEAGLSEGWNQSLDRLALLLEQE